MAYDNLAYKIDHEELELRRQNKKKEHKQEINRLHKAKSMRKISAIIIFSVVAYFMVSKFVAVYDTKAQIKTLEKELAVAQSHTSQRIFELEQSVDLNTIEGQAMSRLGMRRPDKHQTIYVNVQKDDVTEVTADNVEGIRSTAVKMISDIKNNIISIFTMK